MAIFHCHVDHYRRSEGRTSIGGAAYRRGIKIKCDVTGKNFDFRKKEEVTFSKFVPADCDKRAHDLTTIKKLFEEVEKAEKRGDATLGKEIECGLPIELNLKQQIELSENYVLRIRKEAKAENAFFDMSIHNKDGNPHIHICMSEREIVATEDGYKLSKTKNRDWHEKSFVSVLRKLWEEETNLALKKAGIAQQVDSRTLAAQGIIRIPTLHEGKSRHIPEGERTMINNKIIEKNEGFKLPDEEISIEELRTETTPAFCSNPDGADKDAKKRFIYRLAQKQYEGFSILGLSYINAKNPNYVTLWFSDRSRITDRGQKLEANGGTPNDNAKRMVELANLKGWKRISFSGDSAFLEAAFREALAKDLEIVLEGEEQRKILDLIKLEVQKATVKNALEVPKPHEIQKPAEKKGGLRL